MTDPRIKKDIVRHTRHSSHMESRRDVQQSHNFQTHPHAWHHRNPQVAHQYHHHNLGAHQQFNSHEGLTRFDEYGRTYFVQSHPPTSKVFHLPHHFQNAQNPQTFVQQEYNETYSSPQQRNTHNINNHHQHNSFIYGDETVSHNFQQQSTHDPRKCGQQQPPTHVDPRDYIQQLPLPHGLLGFHNDRGSIQVLSLDRELRQLALTPGHTTLTSSEPQEEALFQRHSREHVKVMIELGNKKRIKHPGDEAHESLETRKLSLEVISEHHPVHTKPTAELQIIKTLPISETLRRDATLGGYIFLCKDETMDLEIMNQRFVLPARYKDSVRAITPGTPLFLYNVTRHELHGVFEATSFGTYDTNPLSFLAKSDNDKFPAQVACRIRKRYHALAEEEFRYALSHYDGPRFILQLSVPQVLDIITLFEEQQIPPQDRRHGPFSYCHRDPEG